MLLSLRDELRVVLCREQVQLVRIGRQLTLHGWLYRVLDKKILPCAEEAGSPWSKAIKTLDAALSALQTKPAFARVVLSDHFLHYAMIPWSEKLSNDREEMAYAKHCFSQVYGAAAEPWDIRLSQDYPGAPLFASAVDGQLLQTLRDIFARANVKLKSVQPHFMKAYNNCRAQLQNQDAWFVLVEPGNMSLGLLQQGRWRTVRTLKVGPDWTGMLSDILDREVYLSEVETLTDEVFLWAPGYGDAAIPKSARWKLRKLRPVIRAGIGLSYDESMAAAMCG